MKPNRHTRRYVTVLLSGALIATVIAALVNTWVDPFRVTGAPWASKEVDPYRDISASTRTGKAGLIRSHQDWQVGIFGSSRVISSLDPDASGWEGKKVVNLGMPGAFLYENIAMADYFLSHQESAQLLVLGIDPGDLTSTRDTRPMVDFMASPLNPSGALDRELRYVFGVSTFETSMETLGLQRKKTPGEYNSRGFRDRPSHGGGGAASPGAGQLKFIKNRFVDDARVPPKPGDGTKVHPEKARQLQELMAKCTRRGVNLVLFMHPNHVLLQAKSSDLGKAEVPFEIERRALAEMVARANREAVEQVQVELWDFYSYHPYNRERVRPIEGQPSELVHWRDLEHFTKDVGEGMLSIMMGWPVTNPDLRAYGEKLAPENVEARISMLRDEYQAYLQEEGDGDVAWKEKLIEEGLRK